jgi:ribosomal-protein-alanine N-acetyltransferase
MTVVETDHLLLRPFTLADVPAYAAVREDAAIREWLRSDPAESGTSIAARVVAMFIEEWATVGYGPWAVVDRADGTLIGHHGLRFMPEFGETEVLYALAERARGRGYAVEAGRAALDFAFGTLGLARVIAIALHDNRASRAVMERLGLTYRRDETYKGFEVAYYQLDRAG